MAITITLTCTCIIPIWYSHFYSEKCSWAIAVPCGQPGLPSLQHSWGASVCGSPCRSHHLCNWVQPTAAVQGGVCVCACVCVCVCVCVCIAKGELCPEIILYSGFLLREKTYANLVFCQQSAKVLSANICTRNFREPVSIYPPLVMAMVNYL